MNNPLVIDLSHWNPTPDWQELKYNGTVGVIHKATEGTSVVDDKLFDRARLAMKAGLCWSTYHFFHGNAEAEMDHYLNTIDPRQGERVCIDHEADASLLDLEEAVLYLREKRPDLQITIYSGHLIKDQLGNGYSDILAQNTSLWIAHYTTSISPSWPIGTWPMWSLWQYTDHAKVEGISQPVDANRWNGTEEQLVKWFGPAGEVEPVPPQPAPEYANVDIAITSDANVRFSVSVNGTVVLSYAAGDEVALKR